MFAFLLALALLPSSHAFCGTYVGTDGATVHNKASQVVVATDGSQTVLTLANDYDGDAASFGLIIPVPGGTTAVDITVTDRTALDVLDVYSAPRLVAYSCADVIWIPGETGGWSDQGVEGSSGCGGGGTSPGMSDTSDAGSSGSEAGGGLSTSLFAEGTTSEHFTAGEYELDLVDAAGIAGLQHWLDNNGFSLPDGAESVVAEAVSGGARFLVARVALDEVSAERPWLSPIQVRYDGTDLVLPIRLGATASVGEQDIVVYGISPTAAGALAIANYPQFEVETDCLLGDELGAGYDALFTASYAAADRGGRAGWALEFLSMQGACDPLPPSGTIQSSVLAGLGFGLGIENATLSRLHLRGVAAEIDQDLVLYPSGVNDYWQQDYIAPAESMDAYFPQCGGDISPDAEGCPEPDYDPPDRDDVEDAVEVDDGEAPSSGCCAASLLAPVLTLSLGALLRRRRGPAAGAERRAPGP